ncbi:hypothetical protein [Anatilimnocola floriformis]|uniref:hypothetical protein n=1 Tax=Anatilimnocola floriformis TaxID=2948575 RepID=UPI0020C36819|nr:hypothetical protein [Anatilimnocola floriformis]
MKIAFVFAALCAVAVVGHCNESNQVPMDHGRDRPIIIHEQRWWYDQYRRDRGIPMPNDPPLKLDTRKQPKAAKPNYLPTDGSLFPGLQS